LFQRAPLLHATPRRAPHAQPFLEQQLAAGPRRASASGGGAAGAAADVVQQLNGGDLSAALLAMVATMPDLVEDVPKAPLLLAALIGHFMAAGQLDFGLGELAAAVREAGADAGDGEQDGGDDEQDAPLVDAEKAAPMLVVAVNAIKVCVCVCVCAYWLARRLVAPRSCLAAHVRALAAGWWQ
jgi:hypothetical protein